MRYLSKCLVCGFGSFETIYEARFDGSAEQATEYFLNQRRKVTHGRIVRCQQCGFIFTNPQFEIEEYQRIYLKATELMVQDNGLAAAENVRFARLVKLIEKYNRCPNRLLDLGCGNGKFLSMVSARERIGYEIGGSLNSPSLEYRIVTGDFLSDIGQSDFTQASFDVVTAWDVFEHLPELGRYVGAIAKLLASKGYLFVTLPNADSLIARLSGPRWNMILLEHLWYFSPDTLNRFLTGQGFSVIEHGHVPFDATMTHLANRFAQTYGVGFSSLVKLIGSQVISLPVGLMYAVFQRQ